MELINNLSPEAKNLSSVEYINIKNYTIHPCIGCCKCFLTGKCPIPDDTEILKEKLLNADVIIFSTPVYANNVPGDFKIFIDRISHWTHLFRLYGKVGAVLITTSNSGIEFVGKYLNELMLNLGLNCIDIAHYSSLSPSILSIQSLSKKISKCILAKSMDEVPTSPELNKHFKALQVAIKSNMYTPYEKSFWESNNLLELENI